MGNENFCGNIRKAVHLVLISDRLCPLLDAASLGRLFAKRPEFAIGWCVVERDLIKLGHQNSAVRTLQYSINSFDSKQF